MYYLQSEGLNPAYLDNPSSAPPTNPNSSTSEQQAIDNTASATNEPPVKVMTCSEDPKFAKYFRMLKIGKEIGPK